jgi:hypothetical protein
MTSLNCDCKECSKNRRQIAPGDLFVTVKNNHTNPAGQTLPYGVLLLYVGKSLDGRQLILTHKRGLTFTNSCGGYLEAHAFNFKFIEHVA